MILRKTQKPSSCRGGGSLGTQNTPVNNSLKKLKRFSFGFTLAEVLLTMTIIGIIAAMTIPVLMTSVSKAETETRLKKAYSTLVNAVKLAEANLRRSSTSWDYSLSPYNFYNKYFKNYMVINDDSDCKSGSSDCTFYLADGMQYTLHQERKNYIMRVMIDINGDQDPNEDGIDRFYFILVAGKYMKFDEDDYYSLTKAIDSYWRYYSDVTSVSESRLLDDCESNAMTCSGLLMYTNWEIPDDYPYDI
ncbi:MAG: prepilin-type N-terminal cleavage/methylation domain-containing protein [Candidatus Gastranaerophilales bacterium]|nr:prepilin-type N-terminal cleavage/methylation domain-containing protein [Candidatus Gastranaerophilales bacterium]